VNEALDAIEQRMEQLRRDMRDAAQAQDFTTLGTLRPHLHSAERAWDTLLFTAQPEPAPLVSERPVKAAREQVLETLALTGAPTTQKTIRVVCEAFFRTPLETTRLSSLRRDEVRSYHSSAPRTAYVCSALTAGTFRAARSVLARSDWPLSQRILVPGSERVNFLTMAANLARAADHPVGNRPAIDGLLRRMAQDVPGLDSSTPLTPGRIQEAAESELERLRVADHTARATEAEAASQLDRAHQLFGVAAVPQNR
jgi:hypothetical protein